VRNDSFSLDAERHISCSLVAKEVELLSVTRMFRALWGFFESLQSLTYIQTEELVSSALVGTRRAIFVLLVCDELVTAEAAKDLPISGPRTKHDLG
jgi:hypothetical protein